MTDSNNEILDAEYGLDSRYPSDNERLSEAAALMEARLMRMKSLTKEDITRAKLMQLKLKMEEYLEKPLHDTQRRFSGFLKVYIDSIYSKRAIFAKDVNITPVYLSQILNNHRQPSEEFILKLMIHSEKAYKNVCKFQKKSWFEVYFHEKIGDIMSNQDKWYAEMEKYVSVSDEVKPYE